MKKPMLMGGILVLAAGAFGQGSIVFNNRVIGSVVAPVYGINPAASYVRLHGNATTNGGTVDYTGVPLLSGTGWSAAIYAAPGGTVDQAAFQLLGSPTTFRTSASLAGFVQQPVSNLIVPTPLAPVDPDPPKLVVFQMRVWDNKGGTVMSWEAAMTRPDAASAFSDLFTISVASSPPNVPQNLVGLTSFNIACGCMIVPEPTGAIAGLAAGALVLVLRLWGKPSPPRHACS